MVTVAGSIQSGIGDGSIGGLTAPKLTSVGTLEVDFATVELPSLTQVGAMLIYWPSAMEVSLPALARADSITLSNTSLTSLALPMLTTVTDINVNHNSQLVTLSLPVLSSAASLVVRDNPKLPTCAVNEIVTNLTSAPTSVNVSGNGDAATCN